MKKNWMDYKIGFFPLPIYILLFVLLCIAQYFGAIKINLYTGALICGLFGCGMRYIADNVKIIDKTIGGALWWSHVRHSYTGIWFRSNGSKPVRYLLKEILIS